MIKINKKTEYALMALKYMSEKMPGELTSVREVCEKLNTPFDTTAKVLQIMNQNKILVSEKGINGGYSILKSLEQISFSDLSKIIESKKDDEHHCCNTKKTCELYNTCNIIAPIESLKDKVQQYLTTLTLHELLINNTIEKMAEAK